VTGSLLLGVVAGLLMTLDGLHLTLSRLALLDLFLAFFCLLGVHCLVADRQWIRRRLADPVEAGWGPVVLWRPWLLGAGLSFGLAVGTKWNALYLIAAMGLLFWAWSAAARRRIGVRRPWLRAAVVDALPGVGYLVLIPLIVYVLSWTGWLLHAHEYEQALSDTQYGPYWGSYLETDAHGFFAEAWQSLRSLWHYHHDVFAFHTKFLNDATHTYQSNPLGWPILSRPVGVDVVLDIQPGEQGCAAAEGSTCLRQVLLIGTPVLWWFGAAAMLWAVVVGALRRDWRYGLAVVGFAATWLPWFQYSDRPIFSYYAIAMLPFMILAATLLLGEILGRSGSSPKRRRIGAWAAGTVVVAVAVNFAWFWPIWTDGLITHSEWLQRIWFDRWI
jgi:dolichyl-phosphate-mannose--protein O-mannosyl transferase